LFFIEKSPANPFYAIIIIRQEQLNINSISTIVEKEAAFLSSFFFDMLK